MNNACRIGNQSTVGCLLHRFRKELDRFERHLTLRDVVKHHYRTAHISSYVAEGLTAGADPRPAPAAGFPPPCRLVRNASEVSIRTPPASVEVGGPGRRCCMRQTRKRDRRLGRTSSMICTQAPEPCSQNRALVAPLSARAVTAAQLNTGHHLSTRVPCQPVWPRPVACSQGTISQHLPE